MVEKGHFPIPVKSSLLIGYNHITMYVSSKIEFLSNSFKKKKSSSLQYTTEYLQSLAIHEIILN